MRAASLTNLDVEMIRAKIHPTVIVDSDAQIADDVEVGPFSVIGPQAVIGEKTIVQSHVVIEGEVEIDGCYVGGKIRPANLKENRVDRRFAENQNGKRRVVVALRQRGGRGQTGSNTGIHG